MKAGLFYRTASILLLLFAIGHTAGFRHVDPKWGVDSLIASMQSIHFNASGSDRTYWDFFVGFGLFVGVLMVFASIVTWQLGGLAAEMLARMRLIAWGLVVCLAVVVFLSWRYFFVVPLVFSMMIFVCVLMGALISGERQ